ncbi:hypothetical protein [uncultured Mycobacterium sp.]|uniref:NrtR DNA-binding winged helix domain-containing protein n=1 Tax=uncultured Mycobacterium sp. TaxID=171292 RepID=UPI0035CCA37C
MPDHSSSTSSGKASGSRNTERDPDRLLGGEFTLHQPRLAHESVAGEALQRDAFRRAMEPKLVATGTTIAAGKGRPAELFGRKSTATARRRER